MVAHPHICIHTHKSRAVHARWSEPRQTNKKKTRALVGWMGAQLLVNIAEVYSRAGRAQASGIA